MANIFLSGLHTESCIQIQYMQFGRMMIQVPNVLNNYAGFEAMQRKLHMRTGAHIDFYMVCT